MNKAMLQKAKDRAGCDGSTSASALCTDSMLVSLETMTLQEISRSLLFSLPHLNQSRGGCSCRVSMTETLYAMG